MSSASAIRSGSTAFFAAVADTFILGVSAGLFFSSVGRTGASLRSLTGKRPSLRSSTALCLGSQQSLHAPTRVQRVRKMEMCHDHLPPWRFAVFKIDYALLSKLEAALCRRQTGELE
jgi:hypothetical protein